MNNGEQQKEVRVASIGISVSIKGEIKGSEDLTVDGQVEGKIELPEHTLTIGPNATVVADINAKVVTVFCSVIGTVIARQGRVKLRPIAAPQIDFASLPDVFQKALEQEQTVTTQINALYELAFKEKAFAALVELARQELQVAVGQVGKDGNAP